MSHNTRSKKRKMTQPHGDNFKVQEEESKPSDPKSPCLSSGAASGDNSNDSTHKYVAILCDLETEEKSVFVHTQSCDMGDMWSHKYPILLRDYPNKPIRTGNTAYDNFLPELRNIGYNPLQLLAKGKSGAIILAQDLMNGTFGTGTSGNEYKLPVVIKLYSGRKKKSKTCKENGIQEEIAIHQSLAHANIVAMLNHFNSQDKIGLVLEFCESGNLDQLLRVQDARFITETIARRYFKQMFAAVEYLHLCGLCHRDICTYNILITNDNILKLADFGFAVRFMLGDPLLKDNCGTVGFQAPEVVCKTLYNPRMSDMFSLGCVLYSMAVGHLPFGRIRSAEMALSLKRLEFPKENVLFLSEGIKDLLQGLLAYIPESRFSLNRTRNCDWLQEASKRVHIGNFYLVRQPQKIFEGDRERELKSLYDI